MRVFILAILFAFLFVVIAGVPHDSRPKDRITCKTETSEYVVKDGIVFNDVEVNLISYLDNGAQLKIIVGNKVIFLKDFKTCLIKE